MPFVPGLCLDIELLIITLLGAAMQLVPYLVSGPHLKSMLFQFVEQNARQDSVKHFTQVTADDISCSSLIH